MTKAQTIHHFYNSLHDKNFEEMNRCYHDEIEFSDPAFGKLKGIEAKKMWEMLCRRATDLSVEIISVTEVTDDEIESNIIAKYTFTKTGNKISNHITGRFIFKDDKIITHIDTFNLWRWASQALGLSGRLLGWTSLFKKRFQLVTRGQLKKFIEKNPN